MSTPKGAKREAAAVPELDKTAAAVLAILVAEREERLNGPDEKNKPAKTEVLLANAGLSANEVAQIMGKNLEAVRKAIQRGRK
jgi:DNA-directed RNA polymerase specialized sigma24 family protein